MKSSTVDTGATQGEELPSPALLRLFAWYARRYIRRHFHALRLLCGAFPEVPPDRPMIVVLNHPSWWDPLVGLALLRRFPERAHHAPMDAAALAQYRFFRRLGFFGIERGSVRGAAAFLRQGARILARPRTALWVTAQGAFTDARARPIHLQPGLGRLAVRVPGVVVLPLALEYTHWNDRLPEALAAFGEPVGLEGAPETAEEWTRAAANHLEQALDRLAAASSTREPGRFECVISGRTGVQPVYDAWRRLRGVARGLNLRAAGRPSREKVSVAR